MTRSFDLFSSSLLCFSALVGFVYTLVRFFRPGQALYKKWLPVRWGVCSSSGCTASLLYFGDQRVVGGSA